MPFVQPQLVQFDMNIIHNDTKAKRLRDARIATGKYAGPTEAAEAFGWNVNTYRSHENGNRGYKLPDAIKYARAYRVRVSWLMTGENVTLYEGVANEIQDLEADQQDFILQQVRTMAKSFKGQKAAKIPSP